jgi:hypothetical protein
MRRVVVLAAFGLAAMSSSSAPRHACLAGLRPTLVAGSFTGSVDCKRDRLTIRRVGDIHAHGHGYAIYDYRYQLALMCPECAIHGGRRTIVLRDGRYLGQYETNFEEARVARGEMILQSDGRLAVPLKDAAPVIVRFTAKGPPEVVHVAGEDLERFK